MDNVFTELYKIFCANESVPFVSSKLDDKAYYLHEKIDKMLNDKQRRVLEELLEVYGLDYDEKSLKCFEQGVKLGIKLASGKIDALCL